MTEHFNQNKFYHKVELYVPSMSRSKNRTGKDYQDRAVWDEIRQKWILNIAESFSHWFGGATCIPGRGFYTMDNGGVIEERVDVVYAYATPDQLDRWLEELYTLVSYMRSALSQEAVLLVISQPPTHEVTFIKD